MILPYRLLQHVSGFELHRPGRRDPDLLACPGGSAGPGLALSHKNGMNPVAFLNRRIMKLPRIANWDAAPNFEAIAAINPDVMFIRVGSCWMWGKSEAIPKALKTLEALGIPLIILHSPNTFDKPHMSHLSDEIRIIGRVFDKEAKTEELVKYLESQTELVIERTKDIPESKKPRALLFGLSPRSREAGGAGNVLGLKKIESYFLEALVHARNGFAENVSQKKLSTENVLTTVKRQYRVITN